jgi:hypothetical protein
MRPATFIYVAEVPGGMLKIGISTNPRKRVSNLRGRILGVTRGDRRDEFAAHARFRPFLIAGKEWYSDCAEIREFAASLEQATLHLPSLRLMTGRSGRMGSWPSVRTAEATWSDLVAFAKFQCAERDRLIRTVQSYIDEIERVRPVMEADPTLTYGDAVTRLPSWWKS